MTEFRIKSRLVSLASAVVLFFGLSTSAMAVSLGFGVSGGATHAEFEGAETIKENNSKSTRHEEAQGVLGSAYVQLVVGEDMFGEANGFALGYEHIFGEAVIDAKKSERDKLDLQGTASTVSSYRNYAEATVKNLRTIFVETPGFTRMGLYLKAGWSDMDIITNEQLATGGVYGDASTDGITYGFGFKKAAGGMQVKTEFNYTDWDDISISNTGTDAGASKVTADPENWAFKFSVGYNF